MAARFWVAGNGNWSDNTNHWASSSGGSPGASKPVSGDTATLDGSSGGGTVTADEAIACDSITMGAFTGTLNANNKNVTVQTFDCSGTGSRTLTMGSGTWTVTGSGLVWNLLTTTNLTINANTSTIKLTNSSSADKTFKGGGLIYNNIWLTGSGSGNFNIYGSNTFADFKVDTPPHSVRFYPGTTQTVSTFTVNGSSVSSLMNLTGTGQVELSNISSMIGDSNLVAYYKLEDINDSKASFTLTNNNSATFSTAKFNNGANFGVSNADKSLSINDSLGISIGSCSFSCWVKLNTEIPSGTWAFVGVSGSNTGWVRNEIRYAYNGGVPQLQFNRTKNDIGTSGQFASYNFSIGTSNFCHLAQTYDGTTIKGYVNGVLQTSTSASGVGANAHGHSAFTVGAAPTGDNANNIQFQASAIVDDVSIFNRALSATEVNTLYTGAPGTAWNLSKSSGNINTSFLALKDSVGTGGASWNTSNSNDNGGNSGWVFANINTPSAFLFFIDE